MGQLIRITAPHFVAGCVLVGGAVKYFPPIIKYMKGWTMERAKEYVLQKNWVMEVIGDEETD